MLKFKKLLLVITSIFVIMGIFSGCSNSKSSSKLPDDVEIANFTMPVAGEKIAVITFKDYGVVKAKLFPEFAPKGVENFIGLSDAGYYDELLIHRIVKDFVIQGGDPKGNGTGGNSIWGEKFANETSDRLRNFTGALAYANSGKDTNGSQFYIVNMPASEMGEDRFEGKETQTYPKNVRDKYIEVGGEPALDFDYTVFGQVFEGMDVVSKINNITVDSNEKPVEQVVIEKIEIVEYQ